MKKEIRLSPHEKRIVRLLMKRSRSWRELNSTMRADILSDTISSLKRKHIITKKHGTTQYPGEPATRHYALDKRTHKTSTKIIKNK